MGFMESYKYLDNLCRDMNGVGVTGYIKDMEQESNGEFYITGWKKDYLQLKHYRYIRNQIAHENCANESNMCSDEDTAWLDEFYQRIMKQCDPLALCYKRKKEHFKSESTRTKTLSTTQYAPSQPKFQQIKKQPSGNYIIFFLIAFFLIAFFLIAFFLIVLIFLLLRLL